MAFANPWRRRVALIADYLFLGLAIAAVYVVHLSVFPAIHGRQALLDHAEADHTAMDLLLRVLTGMTYFAAFQSSPYMATPGMTPMGIELRRVDGPALSIWQALARWVAWNPAVMTAVGVLLPFFLAKRQGLHDLIMGTVVLNHPIAKARGF